MGDWVLFAIFIFLNIIFTKKKKKKKKKKILQQPDWPQFWPSAGQETLFLRVACIPGSFNVFVISNNHNDIIQ